MKNSSIYIFIIINKHNFFLYYFRFFPLNENVLYGSSITFKEILKITMPKTLDELKKIGNVDEFFTPFFYKFGFEILPYDVALCMMDSFLYEGSKICFRYAYGIFHTMKSYIKDGTFSSFQDIINVINSNSKSIHGQPWPYYEIESPSISRHASSVRNPIFWNYAIEKAAFSELTTGMKKILHPFVLTRSFLKKEIFGSNKKLPSEEYLKYLNHYEDCEWIKQGDALYTFLNSKKSNFLILL